MGDVELADAEVLNPATTPYQQGAKPLQIVHVDLQTNEVKVNKPNLERIAQNLRDAGAEKISVVSVMGAYRTGKSFLLDLFLRYLEYEQASSTRASTSSASSASESASYQMQKCLDVWNKATCHAKSESCKNLCCTITKSCPLLT